MRDGCLHRTIFTHNLKYSCDEQTIETDSVLAAGPRSAGGAAAPKGGSHAALAAGFVAPPDSVQTSVYWYWLSGNVSKEGVVKDLEAMKRAGTTVPSSAISASGSWRRPMPP